MMQNADLLAPSVNTGIGGNAPFTWDNADWNTTAALSRKTSEARIDTTLANLQLSSAVLDTLTMRANARYYETRNHTAYTAYNPLTGQYGYLAEGGGQGTVVPGESGIAVPGGPSALIVHHDFADPMQIALFLKDLSMAGGFIALAVAGAGSISLDARLRR
jgi:hypothetical protein